METAVYRLIQEAMTNVLKHAGASAVSLVLRRRGDRLLITIADNGKGFDPAAADAAQHLGLAGMRERLAPLKGTLTIDSAADTGTVLRVRIPLEARLGAGADTA
ncbi:MAG TPA: ATP-binding protein [Caulobacteraceae bacterium]|nr:ATP-binding protein [Caulobacteraceae bacterium]